MAVEAPQKRKFKLATPYPTGSLPQPPLRQYADRYGQAKQKRSQNMKKRILLMALFFTSLISCSSKTSVSNSNGSKHFIEFEIGFSKFSNDYVLNRLNELNLPDFSFNLKNDSTIKIKFNSIIKDSNLDYIKQNCNISFFEIYKTEILTHPTLQFFWDNGAESIKLGDSFIAKYAVKDTSKINGTLRQKMYVETLPQDLIFVWSSSIENDSLELHMVKKDRIKNSPNQKNLTEISTEIQARNIAVAYDEYWNPTKWKTQDEYIINLKLDTIGSQQFYNLTKELLFGRIAVSINEKVIAIPKVYSEIETGEISISVTNKQSLIEFYEQLLFLEYDRQNVHIKEIKYIE
ncbi:hypothetical protein LJC52_03520 [Bacteroidales bacterium OttesenSCG-928-A17]|nr:hypothetical protein [Bacteroidales bacterium OttesenSCG-928-A17]